MSEKICKNCAHYEEYFCLDYFKRICMSPHTIDGVDLVTGEVQRVCQDCSLQRARPSISNHYCSLEGRYFILKEEKPKTSLFKHLKNFLAGAWL